MRFHTLILKIILNNQNKLLKFEQKSKNGVYWANQFDNLINTDAHIKTTAQEIWNQTLVSRWFYLCIGTGGTLAGVSIELKSGQKYKDCSI